MVGRLQLLLLMNRFKAIIFDYDGIISESLGVKTEAFAEMYRPYGPEIEQKVIDYHEAYGGVSRFEKFKVYHGEYLNQPIDDLKLKDLAEQFSSLVLEKVIHADYVPGVFEFITQYADQYDFFISTGTPEEEVNLVVDRKELRPFFKEVLGSPEKKTIHVKKIMDKYGYQRSEVVFIGDATTDRDAARANQIEFIGRFTTNDEIKKEKNQIIDFRNFNEYLNTL